MEKTKKLIIVGTGETAEIAYEYFTHDSPYIVVGFCVTKEYFRDSTFLGLPVYEFETIEERMPAFEYDIYVALSYVKLNRERAKMFKQVKLKGYKCASYISSKAFVWKNVKIGENVFVFENNVLQYHVQIGDNVILWSGNHIGHRTVIADHVYISSHCVISGYCEIGEYSFLGVNSTYNDHIIIAKDNIIGSGALVVKNTEVAKVMVGSPAKATLKSSYDAFNVMSEDLQG